MSNTGTLNIALYIRTVLTPLSKTPLYALTPNSYKDEASKAIWSKAALNKVAARKSSNVGLDKVFPCVAILNELSVAAESRKVGLSMDFLTREAPSKLV